MEENLNIELTEQEAEKVLTVHDAIQTFYARKKALPVES